MINNILHKIIIAYKNLNNITYKIMKKGFIFCFILSVLSSILLLINMIFFHNPDYFYIGLSLFKLSLIFAVEFIICGFSVDLIKKQLN